VNEKQDAKLKLMSGIETLQGANSLKIGLLVRIHTFLLCGDDKRMAHWQ
jgi:hypothetical protein